MLVGAIGKSIDTVVRTYIHDLQIFEDAKHNNSANPDTFRLPITPGPDISIWRRQLRELRISRGKP